MGCVCPLLPTAGDYGGKRYRKGKVKERKYSELKSGRFILRRSRIGLKELKRRSKNMKRGNSYNVKIRH
jgi:hypothetical protein